MHARSNRNNLPGFLICILAALSLTLAGCGLQKRNPVKPAEQTPQRIVSLAPSLTEMLYAIGAGDRLVGRTSACDWPKEAQKIRILGAFGRPSLEMLAAAEPDLVLDVDLADEAAGRKITALGIRREHIRCQSPDDIPPALRKLGRLTGNARQADSLATVIEQGLAACRKTALEQPVKKRIYLEIWDDPLWTGGKNSFTSQLIAIAGGSNIGDTVDKEYFQASPEWIISENPDVIACMYMSKPALAVGKVLKRPGWEGITAIRNRKVFANLDNNIYLRPGPRVLDGIEGMKQLLYGN